MIPPPSDNCPSMHGRMPALGKIVFCDHRKVDSVCEGVLREIDRKEVGQWTGGVWLRQRGHTV